MLSNSYLLKLLFRIKCFGLQLFGVRRFIMQFPGLFFFFEFEVYRYTIHETSTNEIAHATVTINNIIYM